MSKYFNKEKFKEIIEGLTECAMLPPEVLMKSATEIYLSSAAESLNGESSWKAVESGCMVKVSAIVQCEKCGHKRGRFVADVLDYCPACGKLMREK